jgi:Fur family ferric uptake transcriptional regulator
MIRRTRQRLSLETVFKSAGRPLTPGEVHVAARKNMPSIGLRTVYRQINDMVADGLIVGVDYPGQPLRYEWVREGHHAHFICRGCDRVYDLEVEVPDVEVKAPKGFSLKGQETVFYGYCPECNRSGG